MGREDGEVDPELGRRLEAAFAAVAGEIRPVRERVLARLEREAPRGRKEQPQERLRVEDDARRPPAPIPLFGRRRALLGAIYGLAAALLLTAYAGYVTLGRIQRQALATEARCEVRNLAIVLRALRDRPSGPAAPAGPRKALDGALARLGLERDPFGNPFACDAAAEPGRVWSYGLNGRNDGGAGDDIVAYVR